MSLNHEIVGVSGPPAERTWDSSDVLLYALGVGAGQADPYAELEFTTENSIGVTTRVLPTFANLISGGGGFGKLGDFDPASFVHAEQAFTLHRPLPVAGTARSVSKVAGMYDKGAAALVVTESTAVDAATGEPLVTTRGSIFIRGEGGFGGDRGPTADWAMPSGPPDDQVTYAVPRDQALLYRLTGDRNPLHSDPQFAARGGFDRPILHGLATYGIAVRLLLGEFCDGDASRLRSVSGRFTKPVWPGEELVVTAWADGDSVLFRTANGDGDVVIDHGELTIEK